MSRTEQIEKMCATEKRTFLEENGREMTPDDVPMNHLWRKGMIALDEPPGFSERYYQLWLHLGGVVDQSKPVTVDNL